MADFLEYEPELAEFGGHDFVADEGLHEYEADPQRTQRDAVLIAIDARVASFAPQTVPPETGGDGGPTQTTLFQNYVRCALKFYQDKVITSERDLVGLVLFGTEQRMNVFDFPHVYVFHELDLPSAARVQELEVLCRAAEKGSAVAKDYAALIGHCDRPLGEDVKRAGTASKAAASPFALSDVLWAAQHMFNHLASKTVAFKRLIMFTSDDDPSKGNPLERDKCLSRYRDLSEAGVSLEVFAHGNSTAPLGHGGLSVHVPTASSTPPPPPSSSDAARRSPPPPTAVVSLALSDSPRGGSPASAAAVAHPSTRSPPRDGGKVPPLFDRTKFWNKLLLNRGGGSSTLSGSFGFDGSGGEAAARPTPEDGGVLHVSDVVTAFDSLLSDVRVRTFPQRSVGTLSLSIGADASAPAVKVGIFQPIMKCAKPRFTWLEASTNAPVTSTTTLTSKETGAEVPASDLLHFAKIGNAGGVIFTQEEVKTMKNQFGSPGIRILGFRPVEWLKLKWTVSRSAFLHPKESECGIAGVKLFVQLHRSLTTKKRLAIAEVIARQGASPRLAALIAATPQNTIADATQGCGFHIVYLPYADDCRALVHPAVTSKPTDDEVLKAKKVIKKLVVNYDPLAIPNPALQRQYHVLQQLALMDDASGAPPPDLSLPDREGMEKLQHTFREATQALLPEGYVADGMIATSKAGKPPPTAEELAAMDFDDLEQKGAIGSLTVVILKQYLKLNHQPTDGLKAALVDRVSMFVKKKRLTGAKRPRDENNDD